MPETEGLDIQRAIEQSAQRTTLSDLARRGIQRVKVLDEKGIQNLIRQAVERVLSARSGLLAEEERAKLMADSRKELDRLMREHNEAKSRAELLQAGQSELIQQVETLQRQLQLQRHVEKQNIQKRVDEETAALQGRVHELEGAVEAAQKEIKKLREQVGRLTGEQGVLAGQLEEARAELDKARKQDAQALAEKLKIAQEAEASSQQALQALRAEHSRTLAEQIELRKALEKAREEGGAALQQEVARLRQQLADEEARHREAVAKLSTSGDLDRKLAALEANIEKKFQAAQESSLAAKLEQLGAKDAEMATKLEKMFARMTDNLQKKLSSMRVGVGAAPEEVDYRPGERMLESLFKQELESNLPAIEGVKTEEAKPGKMEDALAKLKRMQGGLGGLGGGSSEKK